MMKFWPQFHLLRGSIFLLSVHLTFFSVFFPLLLSWMVWIFAGSFYFGHPSLKQFSCSWISYFKGVLYEWLVVESWTFGIYVRPKAWGWLSSPLIFSQPKAAAGLALCRAVFHPVLRVPHLAPPPVHLQARRAGFGVCHRRLFPSFLQTRGVGFTPEAVPIAWLSALWGFLLKPVPWHLVARRPTASHALGLALLLALLPPVGAVSQGLAVS